MLNSNIYGGKWPGCIFILIPDCLWYFRVQEDGKSIHLTLRKKDEHAGLINNQLEALQFKVSIDT